MRLITIKPEYEDHVRLNHVGGRHRISNALTFTPACWLAAAQYCSSLAQQHQPRPPSTRGASSRRLSFRRVLLLGSLVSATILVSRGFSALGLRRRVKCRDAKLDAHPHRVLSEMHVDPIASRERLCCGHTLHARLQAACEAPRVHAATATSARFWSVFGLGSHAPRSLLSEGFRHGKRRRRDSLRAGGTAVSVLVVDSA